MKVWTGVMGDTIYPWLFHGPESYIFLLIDPIKINHSCIGMRYTQYKVKTHSVNNSKIGILLVGIFFPEDPWDDCIFTHMNSWFLWEQLVGKYNSFVDPIVDGWNPANQLSLVVYLFFFARCYTSQVVVWDFWTINSRYIHLEPWIV